MDFQQGPRQMYPVEGDVKCAKCGKQITEAPIPNLDPSRPFYCSDCYKPKRREGGFRKGGFRRDF